MEAAIIGNLKTRKAPEDNVMAEMIRAREECSVEMLHIYIGLCCTTKSTRKGSAQQIGERLSSSQYKTKEEKAVITEELVCSTFREKCTLGYYKT